MSGYLPLFTSSFLGADKQYESFLYFTSHNMKKPSISLIEAFPTYHDCQEAFIVIGMRDLSDSQSPAKTPLDI